MKMLKFNKNSSIFPIKLPNRVILFLSLLLSAGAFIIDYQSQGGFTEWIFYLIPLLIITFTDKLKNVFMVAVLISVLLVIGQLTSENYISRIVVFHRIMGLGMIWTLYVNTYNRSMAQQKLESNQERLKESQLDLKRAQAVAKIGSWRMNIVQNKLYWSEEVFRIFNIPFDTKINYEIFLLKVHPDDREHVDKQWKAALTGSLYEIEHRIIADDKIKWVQEKAEMEFDSHGVLNGGFGTVQDITDRKRMEKDIADQAKFTMEDPNPVMRINHEGTVIFGNDASKELKSLWAGKEGSEILEPQRRSIIEAFSKRVQRIIEIEDNRRTFSLHIVPVIDQDYINVYGREITELRKAELELMYSEEKYRLLFTNTLYGVALHELLFDDNNNAVDAKILEVNPAFENIMGLKAENTIGKTLLEKFSEIAFNPGGWIERYCCVVVKGEKQQFEQFFTPLGKWLRINAFKIRARQFSVMYEDITARKMAEQQLINSEKQLKILNEELENIVIQRTEQVHDLSKALTIAEQRERKRFSFILHENLQQQLLGAKLLMSQHLSEHRTALKVEEYDDIADGVELLNKALQTTKTLTIELNPPILGSEGLDMALQWLANHMKRNYGLNVEMHIENRMQLVRNEIQLMLTQMVRELLNNVVQHSGVHNASLEAKCEKQFIQITVCDKGKGFNPDKSLSEITERTRLGLLSLRERLKLFGGNLIIDSEINKGTCVIISLPSDACMTEDNTK